MPLSSVLPGRRRLLLELDLTSTPVEVEPDDVLAKLRTRHQPRLRNLLRTLHEAGDDPAVAAVIVKVGGGNLPWATMQELRAGLRAFADSGKLTVAWAETLGEGGGGTADYVLATGCDEIWLQPSAELGLTGVAAEVTFLREALDKLGVEPQIEQRYEYKSAADRITRTEFTPEHREALDRITDTLWRGALEDIATARGLTAETVAQLAGEAPLAAAAARDAGLVDRIGYRDEVYAATLARCAEGADTDAGADTDTVKDGVELLFADQWTPPRHRVADLVRRRRDVVAVVDAYGEIVGGRSRNTVRGRQLGSDTVAAALRAARDDERVKSVLFRIDSPGGSAVASDTIWREVVRVREAGKPVVVSMGVVAGSGGYYIACPADVIVAQRATITGSIGVLGGKAVVTGLLERLGLHTGAVERGAAARMFSPRREFTDAERDRLAAMLDRIYDDFVAKVAEGRSMSRDAVHEVARGRVWAGADAAERGLVDVLGGMRDAAAIARERGGLPTDAPLRPALHVPPLARLGKAKSSDDPRAAAVVADAPAALASVMTAGWGEFAAVAEVLGLPTAGPLRMQVPRLR